MGFGASAMALTVYFKMKPAMVNGAPVSGARIVIPINFAIPNGASPTPVPENQPHDEAGLPH
jgi:hypothetical protein